MTVTHLTGDVLDQVRTIPDGSVDLVATSPPFLALRNYNDLPGQWGSEPDPATFLDNLLTLACECRRVLAPHGSIAFELGDTYSGSGGGGGDYLPGGMRDGQVAFAGSARAHNAAHWRAKQVAKDQWPLPKSLCLTPTLFAASLAYGRNLLNPAHTFTPWRVRNLIVWARNNPAVGALGDKYRPATSYITVACPSDRRWFDLDAVRTPLTAPGRTFNGQNASRVASSRGGQRETNTVIEQNPAGAPPLDHWHDEYDGDLTWLVNTAGSSLAHYAMWPAKLASRLVLAMCPREVCRTCGEPRRRLVEAEYVKLQATNNETPRARVAGVNGAGADPTFIHGRAAKVTTTLGWSDCGHDDYRPGHVLDPFSGSGTTLAVADITGRDATGIDLDPGNAGLYPARYAECWAALRPDAGTSPITPHGEQLGLELSA